MRRAYVQVGHRLVHYRRVGVGPAVVMLHDSPRSSRLHLATMAALADRFTVFALDTPGYGMSDPLGLERPRIEDFAQALGATLAALGLELAPLYAPHTGAKIALAYAAQGTSLERLVLDGLSMPETLADEDFIAAYMRPFTPDPAGAYLASEWCRLRDMLRWFPWFAQEPARRIAMEAPDAEWVADYAIDLMDAGRHYADAYAAAMRYDPAPALAAVRCPTLVGARVDDVLHAYLARAAQSGNPHVSIQSLAARREVWLDWLAQALATDHPACETDSPRQGARRYTGHDHGQMHWTLSGKADETQTPWLILSGPTTQDAHFWAAALNGRCLVPDLPGFGESDPMVAGQDIAACLAEGLGAMGIGPVRVLGVGVAAPLAAALARCHPVKALVIDGLPPLDPQAAARFGEGLCPAIPFDAVAGTHNHTIWHLLRDAEAQWPWHDRSQGAIRRLPVVQDADARHAALVGILKQPQHWGDAARAAFALGADIWRDLAVPVRMFAHADPAYADVSVAARLCGAQIIPRPDTLAQAAALLESA